MSQNNPTPLPIFSTAFRTSESCRPDNRYAMVFKFATMEDLHRAEDEWFAFRRSVEEANQFDQPPAFIEPALLKAPELPKAVAIRLNGSNGQRLRLDVEVPLKSRLYTDAQLQARDAMWKERIRKIFVRTPGNYWSQDRENDPHRDRYACERGQLAMGKLTDDELANGAFLNYDVSPPLEAILEGKASSPMAWMTAVKDRIRWLSRSLEAALSANEALKACLPQPTKRSHEKMDDPVL